MFPEPWREDGCVAIPGTTSRASIASLYSMKPNPFMSLISVISPVPCDLKWVSTSALVADFRSLVSSITLQDVASRKSPDSRINAMAYHFEGGCPDRAWLKRLRSWLKM